MQFVNDDPLGNHERYEFIRWTSTTSKTVFIARDKIAGQNVAIKAFECGPSISDRVRREVLVHSKLDHANVITMLEAFLTDNFLCIVLELADQNLWQFVHSRQGCLDEATAQFIFIQLLNAVKYCHDEKVVNRDIKLENCLVKSVYHAGKAYPVLKLCDFKYCKHRETDSKPKSLVGTAAYLCLDILESHEFRSRGNSEYDGEMVDVWNCGISLYFLLEGVFPFGTERCVGGQTALIERIKTLQYDPCTFASNGAQDLLYGIICPKECRLNLDGVMDHWWVRQGYNREDVKALRKLAPHPSSRLSYHHMEMPELENLIQEARYSKCPPPLEHQSPSMFNLL